MNSHEAKKILANGQSNGTPNALSHGLQIIAKHYDDPAYLAAHNYLYAGVRQFDKVVIHMTEDDVKHLALFGWFYDQTHDCFRFEIRLRV